MTAIVGAHACICSVSCVC